MILECFLNLIKYLNCILLPPPSLNLDETILRTVLTSVQGDFATEEISSYLSN